MRSKLGDLQKKKKGKVFRTHMLTSRAPSRALKPTAFLKPMAPPLGGPDYESAGSLVLISAPSELLRPNFFIILLLLAKTCCCTSETVSRRTSCGKVILRINCHGSFKVNFFYYQYSSMYIIIPPLTRCGFFVYEMRVLLVTVTHKF